MENETQLPIDLLTTDEAAAYLKLSPRTLEHWRETGSGPNFVKLGRAVRYSRATIDGYLAESNFRNTAEASKTSRFLRGSALAPHATRYKRRVRGRNPS